MHKIIQKIDNSRKKFIGLIDTKDAHDLPEVTCKGKLSIAKGVIIPYTTSIIGDQKGCHISIGLCCFKNRFI